MTTWITICDTCKRDDWSAETKSTTDGETLAALIEEVAVGAPVRTRRTACLMGCTHGCNVAIQAPEKLCYTIGNFAPNREAAKAIVSYATLHAGAETGQVPYRQWPEGVKGHFVTRHPPTPREE